MKKTALATAALFVLLAMWASSPVQATTTVTHPATPTAAATLTGTADWVTYHRNNARSGVDPNQPSLSNLAPSWTNSTLTGQVYASPLVYGGLVFVATEDDNLYALDPDTGAVQWSKALGTPMDASNLPCGNISPHVGITSTPVIDLNNNRIWLVGETGPTSGTYRLWGVNLTAPHNVDVDIALNSGTADRTLAQGQRGALGLSQGVVYIPFGGRAGDCDSPLGVPYRGIVLGIRATDGAALYSYTTNTTESGIWGPAGESIDASGNVYVSTGNGGTGTDSDTVIVFNPNLTKKYQWAPANKNTLNSADADLNSFVPGLVGGGDVLQGGKSGDAYMLSSTLTQLQGPTHVCTGLTNGASYGGVAYQAPYIYIPCENGLYAYTQSGNTFSHAWTYSGPTVTSPIVAGGAVIFVDGGGSTLYAVNPTTGALIDSVTTSALTHFAAPSTGYGKVFVPARNAVQAFTMGGCSSANMTPDVTSPQAPGATVTFTATATNCTTPEFKFFVQKPGGGWVAQTGFGADTWAWNTAGLTNGVYGVGVWARETGSVAAYETYWLGTFTISVLTCTAATVSAGSPSPSPPSTMVTFTATAARCPGAEFRFWLQSRAGSGTWSMKRDYGAGTWTWDTTGVLPGTYEVGVWARQAGSSAAYDAYGWTTFVLGSAACTSAGLTPNVAPPQAPGANVQFTGSSNGCAGALYQFLLQRPGGAWTVTRSFSSTSTWTWNTGGAAQGTYLVGLWVKAAASTRSYDAYAIATYQIDVGRCTAAGISASPGSPQPAGTSITLTASSTGCTSPLYEFLVLSPGKSTWKVLRSFGSGTTLVWDSTGGFGQYRFGVWARQNGSTRTYDSYAIITFSIGS